MSRDLRPDPAFDRLMTTWLDQRAHPGDGDAVLDAALARTSRTRPLPVWLLPERLIPTQLRRPIPQVRRLAPIVLLLGLLLALAVAVLVVGSARRLPPPFGLAAPGTVAFVADGQIWTANPDGSHWVQLTFDTRTDLTPVFSPDGTKIAFKRLPVPNSKPNWSEWGDVIVADADGGHPVVVDADVHGLSPITWSRDGRSVVYSGVVGGADQVFDAATDGSSTHQITGGRDPNWGPALSPDSRTIVYAKGFPVIIGLYTIGIDGSGERRITTLPLGAFDYAEWSPDGTTVLYGAGDHEGHGDIWVVGLDGRPERRIVSTIGNDLGATWSPDGRSIAYLHAFGAESRVMVAGLDGSKPHPISDLGRWYYPQWSPDATHVVAVDSGLGSAEPIVAILDPRGLEPVSSFALPNVSGNGRADLPSWQRLAP